MSGKCRPSLRPKTLYNVDRSSLSTTDKECIHSVFELADHQKSEIEKNEKIIKAANDLIETQKAEIERLKERDETAEKIIREQGGTILRLKNEVERYSEKAKSFENAAKNTFLEKVRVDFNPLAEAKAEAIKEFAERLKETSGVLYGGFVNEISEEDVDNLVKEMVGDTE